MQKPPSKPKTEIKFKSLLVRALPSPPSPPSPLSSLLSPLPLVPISFSLPSKLHVPEILKHLHTEQHDPRGALQATGLARDRQVGSLPPPSTLAFTPPNPPTSLHFLELLLFLPSPFLRLREVAVGAVRAASIHVPSPAVACLCCLRHQ